MTWFRNRPGASIALFLALVVLAGCDTVCARRYNEQAKVHQVKYQSDVEDESGRKPISDWVNVSRAEYDACSIGDRWPSCKDDAEDESDDPVPEVNPPRRDPKRDEQNRNARTVCFDFVSDPKRKLMYRWKTERREKGPREGTWGIFSDCSAQAQPGETVSMKVEHITGPSTLMCAIYIIRGGKKVPIDLVITQAFGDCDVAARVPVN